MTVATQQPPVRKRQPPQGAVRHRSSGSDLLRLIRPRQWAKGAFVIVGPAYAVALGGGLSWGMLVAVLGAAIAFGSAASACYIFNDIRDRDADLAHPRKRHRPIASGAVTIRQASIMALFMLAGSFLASTLVLAGGTPSPLTAWGLLLLTLVLYVANTTFYSIRLKHEVVLDVVSLASGFVLRVLAGCAAVAIIPSTWLLNVVLFLAMFLAFGKRLGERRTMGRDAADARMVQSAYTDDLLRMAVVVTAVATLITYAGYVQEHEGRYTWGFNLLWLTMLPAIYGLLRCIVLLERGDYDDPTELASRDRGFQLAVFFFALITAGVVLGMHYGPV